MSRPEYVPLESGTEGWDSTVNDNLDLLFTTPAPLGEYTTDGLPAANSYDRCVAVDTDKNRPVYSSGSEWRDVEMRRRVINTYSADHTALDDEDILLADASSGLLTLTIPTAVGRSGKIYTVKKIDSSVNNVVVDPDGAETLDGSANIALTSQWDYMTITSDGTNWLVIG